MNKKISFFSLSILIIAAIDSIRNLPASALFGSVLIFFFLFSALIFLIPTALVSAELTATFPEKGGVYYWILKAFGPKTAMAAIWLQWINTMVWYPSFLSFIAGTFAYLIDPELVNNKTYLIITILTIFWALTLLNLRGIHVSTAINNICALIGTIIPMILLIGLGVIWFIKNEPLQISLTPSSIIPSLGEVKNWVSLVAIMASFLGIELAGVHVNEVQNPQKNFPKAVLIAVLFILFSMIFGSITIAIIVPETQINLVSGVMQVFSNIFDTFGLKSLIPVFAIMIGLGAMGTMINWLISPAKGLLHSAEFGFLPKFLAKTNQHGVAQNILLGQAIVVSIVCFIYLLIPTVNAFYWFLTALSTELYMIMYILIFFAALKLHHNYTNRPIAFKIPYKSFGMWTTCLIGTFGCILTILVTFIPPSNIEIGNHLSYFSLIVLGNILTLSPLFLFYRYRKNKQKI